MPPGVWARREGSPIIGGTREAVKKLLTEGGWPKGTKPTMLVPVAAGTPGMPKLAETIQETLAAADIPITIRTEPEDRARAVLQSGDYGLTLTETTVLGGDPHLFLFPLSTTESASKGPRALNFSYYRNQHLDDVLIRASQLAFRPQRERLYQRAQTMLAADLPWIPLYVRTLWAGVRPEVRGLRLHPTGFHRLTTITVEGP
jgi:ABC-type transport system substrate-binding protein